MKEPIIAAAFDLLTTFGLVSVKADNIAYMGVGGGSFGTIDLRTGLFTLLGNSDTLPLKPMLLKQLGMEARVGIGLFSRFRIRVNYGFSL